MSEVKPSVDQQSSSSQATWLICNDHKTLVLTIIREWWKSFSDMFFAHNNIERKKKMRKEIVLHRNKCDSCWPPVENIQIPATMVNVTNHKLG